MDSGKKTEDYSHDSSTRRKAKGLPKMGYKRTSKKVQKKTHHKKKTSQSRETKFVPLNATNVTLIKEYFESVSPNLFDSIANSGNYVLYQFEDISRDIYLVPTTMSRIVKKFSRKFPLVHCGIHFGYMRRKRTRTGFERAFFLSYEGGEFIYHLTKQSYPEIFKDLQIIQIDEDGAKAFSYGRPIELDCVISEISSIVKKKLIFVFDERDDYIGLALLRVKQAGVKRPVEGEYKSVDDYSRSQNFTLSLMTLTDLGTYLRKGS
ncbi:hypothetical protein NEF87_003664 [Candidatus Lokiarchaeum ossiferum]|uniref:UPF0113 domain-containing protein n=1 Tax=Candidatus Lokiarchaeum ossiferum TaxID=2951803 RepID=A0ABY6HV36_9ARCH|nr:hypothetical protein NEF87_003664 [Candidatus Lokiarchaeum sp. B-35]